MDARLEGTDSEPVLVVELTNTTAEPITVDRELVLCLEVRIQALDGSRLEFERLEKDYRVPPPPVDYVGRLVKLEPGKSIERRIELTRDFSVFEARCRTRPAKTGGEAMVVTGQEATLRLPRSVGRSRIAEIRVAYDARGMDFNAAFRAYTGQDPRDLGLFRGPLQAGVSVNPLPAPARPERLEESAELDARLQGTEAEPVLVVMLTNTGGGPITVDKELVIGVGISAKIRRGDWVQFEPVPQAERRADEAVDWRSRFVKLGPAEKLERRVLLRSGFKEYAAGHSTTRGPTGAYAHTFIGHESWHRLPSSQRISQIAVIHVTYGLTGMAPGLSFRACTGLELKDIGLFEGPAETTLKVPPLADGAPTSRDSGA